MTDSIMQIISTNGYIAEILEEQNEHLPFNIKKLNIGMLCQDLRRFLHWGQCDGGQITDSPLGILTIQTFAKLPKIAPKIPAITNKDQLGRQHGIDAW